MNDKKARVLFSNNSGEVLQTERIYHGLFMLLTLTVQMFQNKIVYLSLYTINKDPFSFEIDF